MSVGRTTLPFGKASVQRLALFHSLANLKFGPSRNEFMAVRNEEGSFFVCQAVQNVYKGAKKIKVRWMTANERVYTPDFYDVIGECGSGARNV